MNIVQRTTVILAGTAALTACGDDPASTKGPVPRDVADGQADPSPRFGELDLSSGTSGPPEGEYQRLRLEEGMRYADQLETVQFRGVELPTGAIIIDLSPKLGSAKSTVMVRPDQENDAVFFEFKDSHQARNAFGVDIMTTARVYRLSTGQFEGGYRLENILLNPDRLREHLRLMEQAGSTAALGRLNLDGVVDDPARLDQALGAVRRMEYVVEREITPELLGNCSKESR